MTSCGRRSAPQRRAAASTSCTRSACCTTSPTRTRASARCSDSSGPGERSPCGSTATRTTASCETWSSRCGACRRRCRRRSCAASPGRSAERSTASRRASTGRSTEPRSALRFRSNEYMASVANFSFRQNYSIVFDQLVAPTAAYIKGPELRALVRRERARGRRHLAPTRQLLARPGARPGLTVTVNESMTALLDLLACPSCRSPLTSESSQLRCSGCGQHLPV